MRILKGYSKAEQRELEDNEKYMRCSDLLHNITGNPAEAICSLIGEKYTKAKPDEQITIIRDILDFYTDKAKFPEQKYYVQLIKNSEVGYLNRNKSYTFLILEGCHLSQNYQTKFTEDEIKAIDPRYMAFAVPVSEVNE